MSSSTFELLVGTTNAAKGRELVQLLGPYGFEIRTLADYDPDDVIEVVEDGETFQYNARKKASELAQHYNRWVLADDSGLEVQTLDSRPGVYSARYAGENATDEQNNDLLLKELGALPPEKRAARYYCHVAVASPTGEICLDAHGVCGGRIRAVRAGTNGFGYDPLFEVVELHRTFGELGPRVKTALSHRGRAMRLIAPQLRKLAATQLTMTLQR